MKFKISLILFLPLWVGCSHLGFSGVKPIENHGPVTLELSRQVGQSAKTRYLSNTYIKDYESGQIIREKQENVEFDVVEKITAFNPLRSYTTYEITTTHKDGMIDLHELAFPELDEKVEVIYGPKAKVIQYGDYPLTSVFYIPPIALPDGPVEVGESWVLNHTWVGMQSGVPLRLEVVSILKGLYPCGKKAPCADIEISGNLFLVGLNKKKAKFDSEIRGRLFFSIETGQVLWSETFAEESFMNGEKVSNVKSCLLSYLIEPAKDKWKYSRKKTCDPKQDLISPVPGT